MHLSPRPLPSTRVLERAATASAAVEVQGPGGGVWALRLTDAEPDSLGAAALAPTRAEDLEVGPVACVAHFEGRRWAFEAELVLTPGGPRLADPRRVRALQRRASHRIAAPPGSALLMGVGDRVLRRPIVDLSAHGMGLEVGGEAEVLRSGAVLPEACFSLPIGPPLRAAVVVRHVRTSPEGLRVAGVDLVGLPDADARRLDAWVRGQTRTRRREAAVRNVRVFAATTATLPKGRPRPVLELDAMGVVVGLDEGDKDLARGLVLERVELRHRAGSPVALAARVVEVVTHRGRPLQARLAWEAPRPEEIARLRRLLRTIER